MDMIHTLEGPKVFIFQPLMTINLLIWRTLFVGTFSQPLVVVTFKEYIAM